MSHGGELDLGWVIQDPNVSKILNWHGPSNESWRKQMPFLQMPMAVDVTFTVMFGMAFILGLLGNISVCVVMLTRRYKNIHVEINMYHANLAVADGLRLLFGKFSFQLGFSSQCGPFVAQRSR